MTDPKDLAFPTNHISPERRWEPVYHCGLSKREYFAAMAMQGILADGITGAPKEFSEWAVKLADSLIEALNKTDK